MKRPLRPVRITMSLPHRSQDSPVFSSTTFCPSGVSWIFPLHLGKVEHDRYFPKRLSRMSIGSVQIGHFSSDICGSMRRRRHLRRGEVQRLHERVVELLDHVGPGRLALRDAVELAFHVGRVGEADDLGEVLLELLR